MAKAAILVPGKWSSSDDRPADGLGTISSWFKHLVDMANAPTAGALKVSQAARTAAL